MKIALLAPPWIAVPPQGYGGTEQVIHNLAEGLVQRGHDVTLFATGDSKTSARLCYFYKKALGNDLTLKQSNPYLFLNHLYAFLKIAKHERFDLIHNHGQYVPMYFLDLQKTPFVHTLHGSFSKQNKIPSGSIADIRQLLKQFKHHPFISISNSQRSAIPQLNYVSTVYNGIHTEQFQVGSGKGNYIAWLGRMTPNKGVDVAIEVAKKTGIPLKIAAFIDRGESEYYTQIIQPQLNSDIEYIGELKTPQEKSEFLGNAQATLFPIKWDEPFGLVMVESMASGTPVIAFNRGSAPEVIQHGENGFLVDTTEEMITALANIKTISREDCRTSVEKNFTVDHMVDRYIKIYEKIHPLSVTSVYGNQTF